jgi:hypothetical protein
VTIIGGCMIVDDGVSLQLSSAPAGSRPGRPRHTAVMFLGPQRNKTALSRFAGGHGHRKHYEVKPEHQIPRKPVPRRPFF